MADAKSLYDILVAEKAMLADRRSSPETALLRETLKSNRKINWVKSEQMLADRSITMGADTTYLDTVLVEGGWTLGSDHKAPSMRLRAATRKFRSEFGETSCVLFIFTRASCIPCLGVLLQRCVCLHIHVPCGFWTAFSVLARCDTRHLVFSAWATLLARVLLVHLLLSRFQKRIGAGR